MTFTIISDGIPNDRSKFFSTDLVQMIQVPTRYRLTVDRYSEVDEKNQRFVQQIHVFAKRLFRLSFYQPSLCPIFPVFFLKSVLTLELLFSIKH